MRYFLTIMLSIVASIVYTQTFNYNTLSEEIFSNNRNGRYSDSKNKLITTLKEGSLNNKERAQLNLLLASTYRSLDDYPSALKYLYTAKQQISEFDADDPLLLNILSEISFCYFDIQNFSGAAEIVDIIESYNYKGVEPLNKAYLLLQKGYVFFLKKDFRNANIYYDEALDIVDKAAPCHKPVVIVKYMQLFGRQKKFSNVKALYDNAYKSADSCNMIKYKLYLTKVISTIYHEHKVKDEYVYDKLLDSLERINNPESYISQVHLKEEYNVDTAQPKNSTFPWHITIILTIFAFAIFLVFIFRFKKQNKLLRKQLSELDAKANEQTSDIAGSSINHKEMLNFEEMTDRQKEIINFILSGLSNKEIAERVFLSEATVKYHIKNIFEKLKINTRKELRDKLNNK